jgi:hypothetical protein
MPQEERRRQRQSKMLISTGFENFMITTIPYSNHNNRTFHSQQISKMVQWGVPCPVVKTIVGKTAAWDSITNIDLASFQGMCVASDVRAFSSSSEAKGIFRVSEGMGSSDTALTCLTILQENKKHTSIRKTDRFLLMIDLFQKIMRKRYMRGEKVVNVKPR